MSTTTTVTGLKAGTTQIIAQCEGIDSNACAVTVSAPPAGNLYPNLPAGLSPLFRYDGNATPNLNTYASTGMALGMAYDLYGNISIASDPTAPVDPPNVLDINYYAGLGPGNAPTTIYMWNTATQTPVVNHYYEAGWFQLVGTTFEGPGAGQWKVLGYWGVGTAGATNVVYGVVIPTGSTASTAAGIVAHDWLLDIAAQNHISWRYGMYYGGTTGTMLVSGGNWYRYELEMQKDSSAGAGDGILRLWLTNVTGGIGPVKILDRQVPYTNSTNPYGFDVRALVPVWGGGGPANKTRSDHVRWARLAGFGA